jgi:hypothetical protein
MITRMQMPRQMYGLGSFVKDRIRKLIPNELASVASKAAPVVAPFNPGVAALMRGIGRFDQRGSISDALKQGVGTFAFGKGVGMLGGAQSDPGLLGRQRFSMEGFQEGPIGRLFDRQAAQTTKDAGSNIVRGGGADMSTVDTGLKGLVKKTLKKLPDTVVAQLTAGGITAGASLLASYFQGDFREQEPGETMEEYLAARKDVVGKQMRTYMDNYFANDPEYSALDDAGRNAFVARYNVRDGGMPMGIMRSNKAGVMERDYRDEGGFVPVGIKEKADDVPAMLSKNEFVMTADAVRGAGNGSIEKGAQKMYDTMKNLERRVV